MRARDDRESRANAAEPEWPQALQHDAHCVLLPSVVLQYSCRSRDFARAAACKHMRARRPTDRPTDTREGMNGELW